MTDHPMLFSAPMVRALLEGRKTQTRRVMKIQPEAFVQSPARHKEKHPIPYLDAYCGEKKTQSNPRGMSRDWCWWTTDDRCGPSIGKAPCKPGDRIWVRETFVPRALALSISRVMRPRYRADDGEDRPEWAGLWKPSIHMPRWASRLTLVVTDVRAQRLQDISEEDARAEGYAVQWSGDFNEGPDKFADEVFKDVWCELYGPGAWDANPWVWALTFEVLRRNIDEVVG